MKKATASMAPFVLLWALVAPALADWDPGDSYKMHFPQLPDPEGWDVNASIEEVADDWTCTLTAPVQDIHIWNSWKNDTWGGFTSVRVRIYDNVPAGPRGYSEPGNLLWERSFLPCEFDVRFNGSGPQGWYDAVYGEVLPDNHMDIQQVNITDIADPFDQCLHRVSWILSSRRIELIIDRFLNEGERVLDGGLIAVVQKQCVSEFQHQYIILGVKNESRVAVGRPYVSGLGLIVLVE